MNGVKVVLKLGAGQSIEVGSGHGQGCGDHPFHVAATKRKCAGSGG